MMRAGPATNVHTHGSAEATVHLEHCKLVEVLGVLGGGQLGIGHDLVVSRRLDAVPLAVRET